MKIFPNQPVITLTHLDPGDCLNQIALFPNGVTSPHSLESRFRERIDEIDFHGGLTAPDWTISLNEKLPADPLETLSARRRLAHISNLPGPATAWENADARGRTPLSLTLSG